ncbi:MAG: restriction endonuclease subunit S [Prevotella sp.]|nr:restriction endonuclease subunit S [Prevotella sp.]
METTLIRIGECINCNPSVKFEKGKTYPVIDIDKIIVGRKFVTNKDFIAYSNQSGAKFENGDTLMARITPCLENGKIAKAQIKGKGIGSTELFVFRGIEGITDNDFVYYLFKQQYIRELSANSMTGASGRQRADLKFIKRIKISLPILPIQCKIASILSAYDSLIENNTKRIRLLEQMAENLYKEWFVRFRFPGYENTEFVNGLPKGWKIEKYSSFVEVMSGGTPDTNNRLYYGGNIPFFTPKDSTDGVFVYDSVTKITKEGLQHCNSQYYPKGTLVITARGTVGKLNLLAEPMAMNQSCFALRSTILDAPYYLYYATNNAVNKLKKMANGGVFDAIIIKTFDYTKSIMPPIEIVKSFDERIKPIMDLIQSIQHQSSLLTRQRDLLLPRLMSGKLEVKA